MKKNSDKKIYPEIFLIASLVALSLLCLLNTIFIKSKLNSWYDNHIDKNHNGLRTFFYDYQKNWDLNFKETELAKKLSFSSSKDKKFQRDGFFLRAIGTFSPPTSGLYKFYLKSDDGSRLYIDQNLIIDNGGIRPAVEKAKTISLRKGHHLVVIEYFQAQGEAELEFNWLKTVKTEKSNDLELFFHPVVSNFQWNKDIGQFNEIIRSKQNTFNLLLWISALVIFAWFALRIWEKMYLLWMKLFKRRELLCIAILLVIILTICFYPVFFKGKTLVSGPLSKHVQDGGGPYWEIEPNYYLHHYFYFIIKTLPLWNPYTGIGFPLIAMTGAGSLCPLPFLASLWPSHLTMDIFMLFRLFLAGFFMYLFLKQIKINPFAAFAGSIFFMLAPPHISCINQTQMDTIAFTPAILFFLEKAIVYYRRKDWFFVAIFIALAILGGNPEEIFLALSLVSLYFIMRVFSIRACPKIKCIRNYFMAVVIGLCLAGFYLIPTIEYFNNSNVAHRSYSSGINLNLTNLTNSIFASKFPIIPPTELYLGIAPFFLILVAILNFKKINRTNKIYLTFSLVYIFIFLSMLFNNPLTYWMKKLPIISHIWWSKYSSTLYIALAISASMGLNILIELKDRILKSRLVFAGAFPVVLLLFFINHSPVKENPILFYYFFVILACIVLSLSRNIQCVTLIGLFILIDLFLYIPREYQVRQDSPPFSNVIVYLKKILEKEPSRVYLLGSSHIMEPNRSCIYQVPVFGHSGILVPKRLDRFLNFNNFRGAPFRSRRKYLDHLGVRYIYCNSWPVFEEGLKEIYSENFAHVYENKKAFPRAFIVHHAEKMVDDGKDNILKRWSDPDFDLRHNIIVEKDLSEEILNCRESPLEDNSYAQFINYTPNKIVIKAVMENDGFLVLSDLYYPGWKAYVDGKRTEIYPTNYLIRSVYLKKGEHLVEFVYRPVSFIAGVTTSFIALICLSAFILFQRKI